MKNDLKNLISPTDHPKFLMIDSYDNNFLKEILNLMVSIRLTEERIAIGRREGLSGGQCIWELDKKQLQLESPQKK